MSTGRVRSVAILALTFAGFCAPLVDVQAAALIMSPSSIAYPENAKPFVERAYWIHLTNTTVTDVSILSAISYEDSVKGPGAGPNGWMLVDQVPAIVPASGTDSLPLILNYQGVVQTGPTVLFGRLRLIWGSPTRFSGLADQFHSRRHDCGSNLGHCLHRLCRSICRLQRQHGAERHRLRESRFRRLPFGV